MIVLTCLLAISALLTVTHGLSLFFPLLWLGQLAWRLACLPKGRLWPGADWVSAAVLLVLVLFSSLEGLWDGATKYGLVAILALTVTACLGAAVALVSGVRLWLGSQKPWAPWLAAGVSAAVLAWLAADFFVLKPAFSPLSGGPQTVAVADPGTGDWLAGTLAPSPLQLGPALGCPTPTSIRIWAAAEGELSLQAVVYRQGREAGRAPLAVSQARNGTGFAQVTGLQPATAYTYDVVDSAGVSVVSADLRPWCRFQTFPADGEAQTALKFALTSCHRPLEESADYYSGRVLPERFVMWETLARQNRESPLAFVLMLGDQVYNDTAFAQALTVQDGAQIRRLYRDNYLKYWSHPAYRRMAASLPAFMMEDDHDTRDGWGSQTSDAAAAAQRVRGQAALLYSDFQGWANPPTYPGKPWFAFDWGRVSFFLPDLRSERDVGRPQPELPLLGRNQSSDLAAWYRSRPEASRVLFFGLSIPLANAPQWVVDWLSHDGSGLGDDFRDAWASPINRPELKTFLDQAFGWMDKTGGRVYTLGGDTHTAMLGRTARGAGKGAQALAEFTSSGISNSDATAQSSWSLFQKFFGQNQTAGYSIQVEKVVTGLNYGLVEVLPTENGPRVKYSVQVQNADSPRSVQVWPLFDSAVQ